jgi:hypothetical protein
MTVQAIINAPYPALERGTRQSLVNLGLGLFVAFFLIVFQPFGLQNVSIPNKNWFLSGFGLVTFFVVQFCEQVIPLLFPTWFKEKTWTVSKQIAFTLGTISLIAFANSAYTCCIFPMMRFLGLIPSFVVYTFSIGLFPVVFSVFYKYSRNLKKYSQPVQLMQDAVSDFTSLTIVLSSDNGKDILQVTGDQLLFLESEDNYVTAFYMEDSRLCKHLMRSTLTRFEAMLPQPPFTRCHRSFIVNMGKVSRVSGNAQGYKLHFEGLSEYVPVARKYGKLILGN